MLSHKLEKWASSPAVIREYDPLRMFYLFSREVLRFRRQPTIDSLPRKSCFENLGNILIEDLGAYT